MEAAIDETFIARVYRTSLVVWAAGLVACLAVSDWHAVAGWTLGSAVSVGVLRSFEWIVRRTCVPGADNPKRALARFWLVKLLVIAGVIAGVVAAGGKSIALVGAFCAGVVLTQTVIFLTVLGMIAVQRRRQ